MPLSHAPSNKAGSEFQVKLLRLRPPSSQQLAMARGGRGLSSVPSALTLSEHRLVPGCEHPQRAQTLGQWLWGSPLWAACAVLL